MRRLAFSLSDGHLLQEPTAPRGPAARGPGGARLAVPISPAAASTEARALDAILDACRTQSSRALLPPRLPQPAAAPAALSAPAPAPADVRLPAPAAAAAPATGGGGRRPPPLQEVAAISCGPAAAGGKAGPAPGKAGPAAAAPPTPSKLGGGLAVGGDAPDVFFL